MCRHTGKNLWLLDYGAAPDLGRPFEHRSDASDSEAIDPADFAPSQHSAPRKRQRGRIYLFDEGFWNKEVFWIFEGVRCQILEHLARFEALHYSDWYVNRAVADIRSAAARLAAPTSDVPGDAAATPSFYCRSALTRLEQWRAIVAAERPGDLASRGLLPRDPRPDQEILIDGLAATSEFEIAAVVACLEPYLTASRRAVHGVLSLDPENGMRAHREQVAADPHVVDCTKRAVVDYLGAVLTPREPGAGDAGRTWRQRGQREPRQ